MCGYGFAYLLSLLYHPYICILYGVPALHFFTFVMFIFFSSLQNIFVGSTEVYWYVPLKMSHSWRLYMASINTPVLVITVVIQIKCMQLK